MKRYQNLHLADRSLFSQYRTLFKTDIDSAHALLSNQNLTNKKFQASDINDVTSDIRTMENYYFNNVPNRLNSLYSTFEGNVEKLYDFGDYVSNQSYKKGDIVWGKDSGASSINNILYIANRNVPSSYGNYSISGYNPFNLVYVCSGDEQTGVQYSMKSPYSTKEYFYFTFNVPSGFTLKEGDIICFDTSFQQFSFRDTYFETYMDLSIHGTLLTFNKYWDYLGLVGDKGYGGLDIDLVLNTDETLPVYDEDLNPAPYTMTYNGTMCYNYDGWGADSSSLEQMDGYVRMSKINSYVPKMKQKFGEIPTSDKYYGCADVRSPVTNIGYPAITILGANKNGSSGLVSSLAIDTIKTGTELNDGEWHTMRIYATKDGIIDAFGMAIYPYGNTNPNDYIDIKNLKLFNLTEIYGEGNEPNLAWCNIYLSPLYELYYEWDSSKEYSEKDAVVYKNNIYVSKTNNNIGNNPETSSANWLKLVNSGQSKINLDNSSLTDGDILFETIT